jgi:hypothetical protein
LSGHAIRRVTLLRLVRALEDAPPIPQLQKLVEDAGWDNERPEGRC